MSFTKEKRESIQRYLLEKIFSNEPQYVKKTADTFNISDKTVYKYLSSLVDRGILDKNGRIYTLKEISYTFELSRESLESDGEDSVYLKYILPRIRDLQKNVINVWDYSFTEMMNNAIDHSGASKVSVLFSRNYLCTRIMIMDNGIGIFKKIKDHYHYDTLQDAVTELFKGKLTTDSKNHSGEGIFFTSRILDSFAAISSGLIFTHDKYYELLQEMKDISALENWPRLPGTIIYMELSNFSKKITSEIFDQYADVDGGFTRTHIPLKNIYENDPVSRSQAKRLCRRFEHFHEVELDFMEVSGVGQGFAHELFVVFAKSHPSTKLIAVNANDTVKKMINHVLKTV